MKRLRTFQMTRLDNSVCFLLVNVRVISSAIQLALLNLIASKENSSAVKGRSKAEEAKCILGKINSCIWYLF